MFILVPLHVSGVWIPYYSDNLLEAGSIGAGLNLALYLKASISRGPCEILVNGVKTFVDQSKYICENTGADVRTLAETPMIPARGFGVSAAALIAHSLGSHIVSSKPTIKALQLAHIVEVMYRTGLGDVIAEYLGGYVIRTKPGAPGFGLAYRVIHKSRLDLVVADIGFTESTKEMLARMKTDIIRQGETLLKTIIDREDLEAFFDASKEFTSRLFDYSKVYELINGIKGIVNFYVKKSALVMWVEREYVSNIINALRRRGIKAHYTTISNIGVTLVHSTQPSAEN